MAVRVADTIKPMGAGGYPVVEAVDLSYTNKDGVKVTVQKYLDEFKGGEKGDKGTTFVPAIDTECNLTWTNDGEMENPEAICLKGDKMTFNDLTEDEKMSLKGEKGDKFEYDDFTTDQLKSLKGDTGYTFIPSIDKDGNLSWTNNGDLVNPTTVKIKGDKGDDGYPFLIYKEYERIEDFDEADFNGNVGLLFMISTKDEQGMPVYRYTGSDTPEHYSYICHLASEGIKGAPFTYEDFTEEQLAALKGEKGNDGKTPAISIGTVTTLEYTEIATASITGTKDEPKLNLGIPKGQPYTLTEADKTAIATSVYEQLSKAEMETF